MELLRSWSGFGTTSPAPAPSRANLYRPLKSTTRHEIRILTLLPNFQESSMIQCTLEHASLFDLPQYTALSYCWGDPSITETIKVDHCQVNVTTNLVAALRRLRSLKQRKQKLWVDAICINQGDEEERAIQVERMRDIYSNAAGVAVWLGPEYGHSDIALDFLSLLSSSPSILEDAVQSRHLPDGPYAEGWKSCDLLFARPYWRRVWVIQEIAVAASIMVHCGKKVLPWVDIQKMLPHIDLVDFEKFRRRVKSENLGTLLQALLESRTSLATDPRDRLYALRGLASDGEKIIQFVNYVQPVEIVLKSVTQAILSKYGCGDVIALHEAALVDRPGLPSWVPNWTEIEKCCRPWQFRFLQEAKPRKPEEIADFPNFQFRGDELGMTGCVLGTIQRLTTSLCQSSSADNWNISHPTEQSAFQERLRDALLFHSGSRGVNSQVDLSELWSLKGLPLLSERYPALKGWLEVNHAFSGWQELHSTISLDYDLLRGPKIWPTDNNRLQRVSSYDSPYFPGYSIEKFENVRDDFYHTERTYSVPPVPRSFIFEHECGVDNTYADTPVPNLSIFQDEYSDVPDTSRDQGNYPDPIYSTSSQHGSQPRLSLAQQPREAPQTKQQDKPTRPSFFSRLKLKKSRKEKSITGKSKSQETTISIEQLDEMMSAMETVLKHGMRFFFSEGQNSRENGHYVLNESRYYGIAHAEARRNDTIAFLRGCSVPVVLRNSEEDVLLHRWKVIGEAHVLEFDASNFEGKATQPFWIV